MYWIIGIVLVVSFSAHLFLRAIKGKETEEEKASRLIRYAFTKLEKEREKGKFPKNILSNQDRPSNSSYFKRPPQQP